MPVSTRRYTELRYTIADLLQRENWASLFEICGTADDEQSKIISVIFSMYDPRRAWKLIDKTMDIPASERRSKRYSMRTICYILGKVGQSKTSRAIKALKIFLSDDHMLREPVNAALSNLWVLDTKITSTSLLEWVSNSGDNDDIQEIAVRSCAYLASQDPSKVEKFLRKVSSMGKKARVASAIADSMITNFPQRQRKRLRSKARPGRRKNRN